MSSLRIVYDDGDEYEGEWSVEGKRQGLGVLKLKNGAKYTGHFINGFFHGTGILCFPDMSKYEGNFEFGKFQGYGVYTNQDGMKFEVSRNSYGGCVCHYNLLCAPRVSSMRAVHVVWGW